LVAIFGDYVTSKTPISDGFKKYCKPLSEAEISADEETFGAPVVNRIEGKLEKSMHERKGHLIRELKKFVHRESDAINVHISKKEVNASTNAYNQELKGSLKEALKLEWMKSFKHIEREIQNVDHCIWCNERAYAISHKQALLEAASAGQSNDVKRLSRAFRLEALGQHYLTDRFAAGHLMNARAASSNVCDKLVGGEMFMHTHDETNYFGLYVTNKKGQKWTAFGDARYADECNAQSRQISSDASAASIAEVYAAYTSGKIATSYAAADYWPVIDTTAKNHLPMVRSPDGLHTIEVRVGGGPNYERVHGLVHCLQAMQSIGKRLAAEIKNNRHEDGSYPKGADPEAPKPPTPAP